MLSFFFFFFHEDGYLDIFFIAELDSMDMVSAMGSKIKIGMISGPELNRPDPNPD